MGKRLDKMNKWMDEHADEAIIVEGGLLGAVFGWLLTDPTVFNWARKGVKKGWQVAKENIHLTIGKPSGGPSVTIDGGSGGTSSGKSKLGYYDYMDRCEQRRHEERMAQIKSGKFVNDEGGTVE